MDKARDVRRGATRFKHTTHKLCVDGGGEEVLSSLKSKKEKVKKLSAVVGRSSSSQEDCEMGFNVSDKEDELRSPSASNKFQLSKKFSDDGNGVGQASVPRKLRSAMKKRGRDSVSPPLSDSKKKIHTITGIHSQEMSAIKKPKSILKQKVSNKPTVSMPITKDEEEVAETLYALARMFSNNNSNDKSKRDTQSLQPNPSNFPESKPAVEAKDNVINSTLPLRTKDDPSSSADKLNEMVKVDSSNKPNSQSNPISLDDYVPRVNPFTQSYVPKSEQQLNVKPLNSCSAKFRIPSEVHLDTRFKQPQQKDPLVMEKEKQIWLGKNAPILSSKKAGMGSLPGPSSTISQGARVNDTCTPLPTAKIPAWLDVPSCSPRTNPVVQNQSIRKVSKAPVKRRLSKRCATHVYISQLIQALKKSGYEDVLSLPKNQKRSHEEGLKQGVAVTLNNNMYGEKNDDLNGLVSDPTVTNAVANKTNSNGVNNGILQQRFNQDQPLQKQRSFDFLSLSAGSSRTRNVVEPLSLSPLQVPYPHSLVQNQFHPQSSHNSAYLDHISSAGQVHPYGNLLYHTQASSTGLTKPQQQQVWSGHYRPDDTPKTTSKIANWQNGPTTTQHHHHQQQQHQQHQQQHLMSLPSSPFPAGKMTKQDHHMPSVYEEHGGGFRASSLPLQLLCHERR
ncbi:uncharacterized protein LOC115701977 isoform X1 [Cannabis sativa]|uniref:uncharacterized protein LOC115701977 isoform X1 n=2 Tax=Cannabis sativa TaxID=3483 RepID=UPI0029CA6C65|nr:uncharacterized protein LOC115701977 isoform X1 [Cannabis sativa]XP_060963215.1 uncharacterized protein LOC115701977 isoform X1 [Cannabis sativa]XP_060963216.1 uncharacterized protein LOC115701977 isoform X1 [Cannabis sativa]XP_060963217.1 uncharacterized protein LOC115701977 isoform X1 [Cannabis sativa]